MAVNLRRVLEEYIDYREKLTPRSIRLIEKLAVPYMAFTDPFNDVQGIEEVETVFEKMFSKMDRPSCKIDDAAWGRDEYTAYLRWTLTFSPKGREERRQIAGISEICFTRDGKIYRQTDYWDSGSQQMSNMPLPGWLSRRMCRRRDV